MDVTHCLYFFLGALSLIGRVGCNHRKAHLRVKGDVVIPSALNQSTTFANSIFELLIELNVEPEIRVGILYSSDQTEIIRVSKELMENSRGGITVFRDMGSMASIKELLKSAEGTTLFLVLCSYQFIIDLFAMIFWEGLENPSVRWLFISEMMGDDAASLAESLESLFHEGTHITILTGIKGGGEFSVYSSRVDSTGIVRLQDIGVWDSRRGGKKQSLQSIVLPDESSLRVQMSGRKMKVATNNYAGFFDLTGVNPDGSKKPASGIDVEILKALSDVLNFTYKVVRPADGLWGNPLPNGTVTGLIGVIARREAHFAICAISVTSLRETVVDFTHPYFRNPHAVFSRAPKEKNRALAVLSPFTFKAWISIIASVIAVGPILAIYSKVSEALLKRRSPCWSLHRCSFNMFRVIVIQGNRLHNTPDMYLRLTFCSWYLFCFIISALYSGMLIAVLAIPAYETPVDSLTDLPRAVREGFTLTILKDSSGSSLFKQAKEGIYRDTWKLFNHEDPTESFMDRPETGIHKILEGKYLFIGFRISSEILASNIGRSKFHIARQTFYPVSIGIVCPQGAPYRDTFSFLLMRMEDAGLISKWSRDEIDKFSQRISLAADSEQTSSAITLIHLQAGFFIFGFGCFLSSVTFVLEKIIYILQIPRD